MTSVSEVLALRIENLSLKLHNLQHAGEALAMEQKALIAQARIEAGAPVGHVYNTETRQFQAQTGPVPLSTRPERQAKRAGRT